MCFDSVKFNFALLVFFCYKLTDVHTQRFRVNTTNCEPTAQLVNNETIWWGNYSNEQLLYTSSPICLNSNFEIIKRFCLGGWFLSPHCTLLQEKILPCPENFSYFEEGQICYSIVQNQTFPPICPYPNVMSFFEYKVLLEKRIVEAPVWVPAKIISDYGVGTMIIIEPTEHYGSILSVSYYWKNAFRKDCLIYASPWSFEAVYCNSTYNTICAYHPLKNMKYNYCSRNQSRPCIMSDFDVNSSKCLCVESDAHKCENLAELRRPQQNFISTNGTKCRIGLENREGRFVWVKSQAAITYSNWSIATNFYNKYGAIQNDVGWSLEEKSALSCAICEEEIQFQKSSLKLTLDAVSKHLVLTVTNMQDLVITSDKEYPVFCFSDTATTTQVRKFSESHFVSFSKIGENKATIRYHYSRFCPGHYWCEALQYPNFSIVKTNQILVIDDELYGNEFVTTLLIQYTTYEGTILQSLLSTVTSDIKDCLKGWYDEIPFYLRWMSALETNEEEKTVEYLIHVTSKTFKPIEMEQEEFTKILTTSFAEVPLILNMSNLLSVKFCLPSSTISAGGVVLQWPLTQINATVIPFELCLQDDGSPVTRSCFGDFLSGAKWTAVNGSCSENPVTSTATESLYNLLHSNESLQSIFQNLTEITERSWEFLTIDVHFIARILDAMDKRYATDLSKITRTIDNILNTQRNALRFSQLLLNSTDKILYNFDMLLQNFYKERHSRTTIFSEIEGKNLIVLMFDARSSVVRGLGLYDNHSEKTQVKFLEQGTSHEDLVKSEDLLVATYIPDELIAQINNTLPADEPLMIVIYVFMNDYLFNEDDAKLRSSNSKIFGVLLPPISEEYVVPIPTIFRPSRNNYDRKCAFWNYGTSNEFGNFRGRWEEDLSPISHNETDLELCQFSHTTHFSLLLLGDLTASEQGAFTDNQSTLSIITAVGCGLSIFGILIILLTCVLFKRWRDNKGNQILVQFGLVTIFQICLLYTSSQIGNNIDKSWCILVGALLHFAVLSQFCWMLVMAILQYRRFVLVFIKPSKWILLKACLFGYAVPTIPVIVHVTVFNDNYIIGETGMCYPTGYGFYIGVIIPGGCIILANLIIFCIITWNIFRRKLDNDYSRDYALALRLRLVFVLFFMLGMTWIFGFVAELTHVMFFVYLFCSTASLQGFIMFLAFIVCNENTRKMYIYLIKTVKYRCRF